MKLNYFAYTITDNNDSNIYFDNISDIIKSFCLGRERALFEKNKGLKKLYLAMPSTIQNIYYLTTPAVITAYKAVNRASGIVNDLSAVLGKESLEKVTYFYIDPSYPIIGITEGKGGADVDDLQFFINEILNHGLSSQRFSFKISTLKVEINAKSATKFKLITEARVKLNNTSVKDVVNGLFGKDLPENMEVEVVIKRTNRKENVKDYIAPLLTKLEESNEKNYAQIYFRAKADEFQSNIKSFILDKNQNIFDIINPHAKMSIEDQIIDKRYRNQVVTGECEAFIKEYTGRIKMTFSDNLWMMMKTEAYHKQES